MKAINEYMSLLRTATLGIEAAVYDLDKKMYGKDAFIGLHDTFHNNLDRDEVWQTGVSWWNIKKGLWPYGLTRKEICKNWLQPHFLPCAKMARKSFMYQVKRMFSSPL